MACPSPKHFVSGWGLSGPPFLSSESALSLPLSLASCRTRNRQIVEKVLAAGTELSAGRLSGPSVGTPCDGQVVPPPLPAERSPE